MNKCKCRRVAVGFFNGVAICRNCFRSKYTKLHDGRIVESKSAAMSDDGVMAPISEMARRTDFVSGKQFLTRRPVEVRNGLAVDRRNVERYLESGDIVDIGGRYYAKKFVVRSEHGNMVRVGECERVCVLCRRTFHSFEPHRTIEGVVCHQCAKSKAMKESCRECGNLVSNIDDSIKALTLGNQNIHYKICRECMKRHLPFEYKAIREIAGVGRTIGLEVECEPTPESQIDLALWGDTHHMVNATTDGSLRGKYPCEFTSPILHESNYSDWIDEFCSKLRARVYSRCGYHVHIGTSDMKWWQMMNIMRYFKRHEGDFFAIVSPSRRDTKMLNGNNAGLPVLLPDIPIFRSRCEMLDWCYGKQRVYKDVGVNIHKSKRCNDRNVHYDGQLNRYQWVNFHGHFFKGAIEIRSHQGTTNPVKMKRWIELMLHIIPHASLPEKYWRPPLDVAPKHLETYYKIRSIQLHNLKTSGKVMVA